MSDAQKTSPVGVKVTDEKKQALKDLAYERRTTVSELLREEIDELLETADEVDHPHR
jgi:hypothetical protein